MKLNKKGFMLAEVTIVATLAATVMMLMYSSSIKTINAYKERENYYDVDTIYATGYIYDYIMDNKIDDYISTATSATPYGSKTFNTNPIKEIISKYNVKDVRFIKSKTTSVNDLKNNVTRRTFKNYLENYVKKNVSDSENDKYILIVEREVASPNDSNKKVYYYYSVEV